MEWYTLTLISSLLMGASSITEKKVLRNEHATAYSASFALITGIIALIVIPLAHLSLNPRDLFLLFVIAAINTVSYILTARVYKHGSITIAFSILSSLPVLLIIILAFVFLGEHLTLLQYAAIGTMIAATYLLLFKPNTDTRAFEKDSYKYMLLGICVLNAMMAIIIKYTLATIDPIEMLTFTALFMAIDMLAYMQVKYGGIKEIASNIRKYKFYLIPISLFTLSSRFTNYLALVAMAISLVGPLRNTLFVIMGVIAGKILFDEKVTYEMMALIALLLITSYIIIL